MRRRFNVTGSCVAHKHYMVDISHKFNQVMELIEMGEYFAINRPCQYGKTTMLTNITKVLRQDDNYILSRMSFAGVGDTIFENEQSFSPCFVEMLARSLERFYPETAEWIRNRSQKVLIWILFLSLLPIL